MIRHTEKKECIFIFLMCTQKPSEWSAEKLPYLSSLS
jgi:hypothetical protein